MDLSLFSIEQINKSSNNSQIRLFIGKTCIISTVQGAQSTNSQKACEQGIVEVSIKMEFRGDQKKQRYMESILSESLESNIKLEEYPSKQIKIILQVICNEGNLFSALYNAAIVSLLHNGCKMRTTTFAYEFIPLSQNTVKLFPTKKEHSLDDDFDQACVVLDLNTQGIVTLVNQKGYKFNQIQDGIKLIISSIQNTKDLLKSYLYQQYTKNL
ncbi:3' exoribonuclease family 1 protein (macronuclear) [Tetrahymena thermophila SB210]|uniref:3' exoribonuclease family 1 protein n=1 Tax=Tetrahymena thermophila (strain SB210) TaxID=312017 RepID=Q22A06_TETTS|nr:3' exoribonuclease family 1 protein [Tetrahymena thermophila SB210]EAR82136.2 3' exoribonuclease family 1 protein [Tetrahymena thermophila SB210]|eukprot:XP_001029799.2 3' exoribonuclease family 1 protein [Tetrahymena thermophila SB210]